VSFKFLKMSYFPIFIQSRSIRCLIVGGGKIAGRKARALIRQGINPVIIAPAVHDEMSWLIAEKGLEWHTRSFAPGDTKGYTMVIAATSSREVNRAVGEEVGDTLLFDDASDGENSRFVMAPVVERGLLKMAISTSGKIPYLSSRLARFLESQLGEGMDKELLELASLRSSIIERAGSDEGLKSKLLTDELEPVIQVFLEKYFTIRHPGKR
jgi:siroheme synthase-like protein